MIQVLDPPPTMAKPASSRAKTSKKNTLPAIADLPKVIAFANQKGGVGKSTSAVHAAVWFAKKGLKVAFVDADAQQSSSSWVRQIGIDVVGINDADQLFEQVPIIVADYDLVIIDGPGSASETTKAILNRADLVLIPLKESRLDVGSTAKIVQFVGQSQELRNGLPKAAFFLSDVNERTVLYKEARVALANRRIKLLEAAIPNRTIVKDSPGQATTVFEMKGRAATAAKTNYDQLFNEAVEFYING
jgi:chromosome partitioning protein